MSFFGSIGHFLGKVASNPIVDAGLGLIPGVGPGIAAGAHVLGGLLNGGTPQNGVNGDFGQNKNTQTGGSQGLDANTQAQLKGIQNAYGQAGAAGPGSVLNGAAGYGTSAQTAGNLGFGALSGDPNASKQLMNPYIQNVIDANNANLAKTQLQTTNQINDQATKAGAFGGSRQGVAEGVALANNQQNNNALNANLLNNGYNTAMQQANTLAGYGLQGAQLNANLGFGGVGNQALWNAQQLRNGFIQPTGSQYSSTQNTNQNNGLQGTINGIGDILGLFKNRTKTPTSTPQMQMPASIDPGVYGGGMF